MVRLKISDFKLTSRTDLSLVRHQISPDSDLLPPDFRCLTESLEIRLTDPYDGSFFCGNDLQKGRVLISRIPNVTIMLHNFSKLTSLRQLQQRRLKIEVDFVDSSNSSKAVTSGSSGTTVKPFPPLTSSTSILPPFEPSLTSTGEPLSLLSGLKAILDHRLVNKVRQLVDAIVGTMIKLIPSG